MKQSNEDLTRAKNERRMDALERLKASTFEQSRAYRLGSLTHEEWQTRKNCEIGHLEDRINGRKSS